MVEISSNQMCSPGGDRGEQDWCVFGGERNACGQCATFGLKHLQLYGKFGQATVLRFGGEVGASFFERITAGTEHNVRQFPEAEKSCTGTVGGGEQDVGVEKEPVHETALLGATVGDGVRVETQFFDFAAGTIVVGAVCCVGKQEFCFAFWSVFFDGDEHGGAKQDAFVARLSGDVGAFLQAKAAAEVHRYDDGAAFANAGRIQARVSNQDIRESVYQIFR
jgi:hypothetical protein